jgi:hypothetical protein
MAEFLKSLRDRLPFRRGKEGTCRIPTAFVLVQNGNEQRLNLDVTVLKPEPEDISLKDNKTYLSGVLPHKDYVSLMIVWDRTSYTSIDWGLIEDHLGGTTRELGIRIARERLDTQGDTIHIRETGMYLTEDLTRLHGPSWTIEYRPES